MQHKCRFEEALVSIGKATSGLTGFANMMVAIIFTATNELATLDASVAASDPSETVGKNLGIVL